MELQDLKVILELRVFKVSKVLLVQRDLKVILVLKVK